MEQAKLEAQEVMELHMQVIREQSVKIADLQLENKILGGLLSKYQEVKEEK